MNDTVAGYTQSARIARLRQRVAEHPEARNMGAWRDYFYLEGWMRASGQPLPVRNAEALANVIERMPIRLAEDDLLVGEHGNDHSMVNFRSGCGPEVARSAQASGLPENRAAQMAEWLAAEPFRWIELAPVAAWPEPLRLAQERCVVQIWGTDLNHSIRAYEKVLRLGFRGLCTEVDDAINAMVPEDPQAPARLANLQAFRRIAQACMTLGERHAEALQGSVAPDKADLIGVCRRVPALPASTFREALQALWFAHMVTVWEDGVNANGIGRIDQFLWPYLEADLQAGRITMPEAAELLAALWAKLYQPYDVQQMMVGGQTPSGDDAVNPLSYVVLDVTEGMGFVRCLSARLHRGSPRRFVERCVDLVARGGGIPFFFNDDALVPALSSRGIPIEDARGYAAIGCIEITIPGKASPHAVSNWINLPKVLELALNGGRDPKDGAQIGPPGPELPEHATIDDVWSGYERQLDHFARWAAYGSNSAELAHRGQYRLPYLSLLTDDCVARGLDIIEGGALYNYHSSAAMGVPNVADSLTALDDAVYRSKRVAPAELLDSMRRDYGDEEDLRHYLMDRLPKYGNDEPEPDEWAARLVRGYVAQMDRLRTAAGGRFFTHLFTFTLMLPMGRAVGATPDGRRSGEPLAYSVSPGQGRDRQGLTAVMRSLAALPHDMVAASSSAIIEADPTLLEGPGRRAFADLLQTAIRMGVGQLQFNVVSAETLRAAQEDPDRYRNLCVRVSGFSQRFNLLDREMQDHIIARTKHARA